MPCPLGLWASRLLIFNIAPKLKLFAMIWWLSCLHLDSELSLLHNPPQLRTTSSIAKTMAKILVLHGPNLNLLGTREPELYGQQGLDDINAQLQQSASTAGHQLNCFHSNAEYELIEQIHKAQQDRVDFIIINPAAFTHSSIALRDALLAVAIPFIEIHLSNIYKRESFRQHSYFSDVAVGLISGLGAQGYQLALQAALNLLNTKTSGD